MHDMSHNLTLLIAAAALALMAAFTGLCMTNGLSRLSASERKPMIVRSAIVIGGGIWSTHFVSILSMDLPGEFYFDPFLTLTAALIAILLSGAALLLLHFGVRSNKRIVAAGVVMGLGVVAMHYIGMLGMLGYELTFETTGYVVSTIFAVGMSIGALKVAYAERSLNGLIVGSVIYAMAILAMHFSAMYWTGMMPLDVLPTTPQLVSNDVLALLVVFSSFLICGSFLLTTVTARQAVASEKIGPEKEIDEDLPSKPAVVDADVNDSSVRNNDLAQKPRRLPYEQDGGRFFVNVDDIFAVQSEGHYTWLLTCEDKLFCPIGISKLAKDLTNSGFVRTHRSYLANLRYVRGFERHKDQGVCLFDPELKVDPIPISRAKLAETIKALGN